MVVWSDNLVSPMYWLSFLEEENSWKLIVFMFVIIVFWALFVSLAMKLMPKKYYMYKKEILLFLVTLNFGLLFMGLFLTIALFLFGLYWATFKVSKPIYERINFEQYFTKIPMVDSKFHEDVLHIESSKESGIDTNEMIKSMETLYGSAEQNNIDKIKHLLSSTTDEVRLLAFSQVSSYEKELLKRLKEFTKKKNSARTEEELESYNYLLAETYWQFIFHGVADQHLVGFYIEKIEKYLNMCGESISVAILYGKINLYRKEYLVAKDYFLKALHLGASEHQVFSFLAEVEYELKNFNNVGAYMLNEMFNIDLKMKPYYMMWSR